MIELYFLDVMSDKLPYCIFFQKNTDGTYKPIYKTPLNTDFEESLNKKLSYILQGKINLLDDFLNEREVSQEGSKFSLVVRFNDFFYEFIYEDSKHIKIKKYIPRDELKYQEEYENSNFAYKASIFRNKRLYDEKIIEDINDIDIDLKVNFAQFDFSLLNDIVKASLID